MVTAVPTVTTVAMEDTTATAATNTPVIPIAAIRDMGMNIATRTPTTSPATGTRRAITSQATIRTRSASTTPIAIIMVRAMEVVMVGMDTNPVPWLLTVCFLLD